MEEEINYASVVFKNGGPPPKEKKEDQTIYADVKPKGPTTTASEFHNSQMFSGSLQSSNPKGKEKKLSIECDGQAAARSHFRVLPVCLGILCVLLVVSISAIIYISVAMNRQKADLSNLIAQNEKLIVDRSNLEKETKDLNWTLGVILTFNNFPVNEYCPKKTGPSVLLDCNPCKKNWIAFQEKCYLFYNESSWRSWGASRKYCQDTSADLVVINSQQEQEFISNNIKSYFDKFHGFWLGLKEFGANNWVWVDGHNDTLNYWMEERLGATGPCALMIPGRNVSANWDPAECTMNNKFICEHEVLIKSN